jgi:N utilization substance protein A
MAQIGISANRLELLQIADAVAREKSIDRTLVLSAMEAKMRSARRSIRVPVRSSCRGCLKSWRR